MKSFSGNHLPRSAGPCSSLQTPSCYGETALIRLLSAWPTSEHLNSLSMDLVNPQPLPQIFQLSDPLESESLLSKTLHP